MKIIVTLLLFLFLGVPGITQLDPIRDSFFAATSDEGIKSFYQSTSKVNHDNAVVVAYHGVSTAMRAEVAGNVADKFSYFAEGKEIIEQAVKQDWYNPEIRFLRFSVQSQVPFFVGYSSEKQSDIEVILYALEKDAGEISVRFWKRALLWLNEYGDLNDSELQRINTILVKW